MNSIRPFTRILEGLIKRYQTSHLTITLGSMVVSSSTTMRATRLMMMMKNLYLPAQWGNRRVCGKFGYTYLYIYSLSCTAVSYRWESSHVGESCIVCKKTFMSIHITRWGKYTGERAKQARALPSHDRFDRAYEIYVCMYLCMIGTAPSFNCLEMASPHCQ